MTTSNIPARTFSTDPLRVLLADPQAHRPLDGGWWPHSRDLATELAELVEGLPAEVGRPVRAVYSPPDWDTPPRRVPLPHGYLKVGCFPRDDSHVLDLRMLDGTTLRLLVVPPTADAQQARFALRAAAGPDTTETAATILTAMSDHASGEQEERWTDDGDAWWDPHPLAPSYRSAE